MSDYTDYMEDMFFNHVFSVRMSLESNRSWMRDYVEKRSKYPDWVTRDGRSISVKDISDEHLENLLKFLPNGNVWHDVFMCEKKYRYLCDLEREVKENENVIETVF